MLEAHPQAPCPDGLLLPVHLGVGPPVFFVPGSVLRSVTTCRWVGGWTGGGWRMDGRTGLWGADGWTVGVDGRGTEGSGLRGLSAPVCPPCATCSPAVPSLPPSRQRGPVLAVAFLPRPAVGRRAAPLLSLSSQFPQDKHRASSVRSQPRGAALQAPEPQVSTFDASLVQVLFRVP